MRQLVHIETAAPGTRRQGGVLLCSSTQRQEAPISRGPCYRRRQGGYFFEVLAAVTTTAVISSSMIHGLCDFRAEQGATRTSDANGARFALAVFDLIPGVNENAVGTSDRVVLAGRSCGREDGRSSGRACVEVEDDETAQIINRSEGRGPVPPAPVSAPSSSIAFPVSPPSPGAGRVQHSQPPPQKRRRRHADGAAATGAADEILPRADASTLEDLPFGFLAEVAPFVSKLFLHNVFDALVLGREGEKRRSEINASWRAFYNLLGQRPHLPMPVEDLSKLSRQLRMKSMQQAGQSTMQRTSMPVGHPYGLAAQLVCYGADCGYSAAVAARLAVDQLEAPLRHCLKLLEDALTQKGMREVEVTIDDQFIYRPVQEHPDAGSKRRRLVQHHDELCAKVDITPAAQHLRIMVDRVPLSEEELAQLPPLDTDGRSSIEAATLSNGLLVLAHVEDEEAWKPPALRLRSSGSSSQPQRFFDMALTVTSITDAEDCCSSASSCA
ncbi:unnamed protein product [Amoebophrya sp. A120]|nr:unnamed protein product [Amoebophrya sp. A120]|eukprot:GSA120T00021918001.1